MTTGNMRQMPSMRREGTRSWVVYHANLGGHRKVEAARAQKLELMKNEEREIFKTYSLSSSNQRARVCECW